MSYIHEALKKAQKEKECFAGKCNTILPSKASGPLFFKRDRAISLGIVFLAVAFAAYSWLQSIDSLPSGRDKGSTFFRATINAPAPVPSNRPPIQADNGEVTEPRARPLLDTEPENKPLQQSPFAEMQNRTVPALAQEPFRPQEPVRDISPSGSASTLYQQALARQKEGQLQEAINLYKAVLKASPNLVSALNNLGAIYIQQKNLPEARKVLEKAIRTDVTYVDPYYNLACLHAQQKDIGRSLFYLKKAISVDEAARQWAKTDEDLENLRGHVEYEKIINRAQNS